MSIHIYKEREVCHYMAESGLNVDTIDVHIYRTTGYLQDKIPRSEIRKRATMTDFKEYTLKQKWKWAGHIVSMKDNRWTKRYTEWQPRRGKRSRGRPSRRWQDGIGKKEGTSWNRKALGRETNGRHWWRATSWRGWTKPWRKMVCRVQGCITYDAAERSLDTDTMDIHIYRMRGCITIWLSLIHIRIQNVRFFGNSGSALFWSWNFLLSCIISVVVAVTISYHYRRNYYCYLYGSVYNCSLVRTVFQRWLQWWLLLLFVGYLTSQQHARRDGSAKTTVRAATLRKKLQINFPVSRCHSILTPGQSIPTLTL